MEEFAKLFGELLAFAYHSLPPPRFALTQRPPQIAEIVSPHEPGSGFTRR
jgi:hypothetical protein